MLPTKNATARGVPGPIEADPPEMLPKSTPPVPQNVLSVEKAVQPVRVTNPYVEGINESYILHCYEHFDN